MTGIFDVNGERYPHATHDPKVSILDLSGRCVDFLLFSPKRSSERRVLHAHYREVVRINEQFFHYTDALSRFAD